MIIIAFALVFFVLAGILWGLVTAYRDGQKQCTCDAGYCAWCHSGYY